MLGCSIKFQVWTFMPLVCKSLTFYCGVLSEEFEGIKMNNLLIVLRAESWVKLIIKQNSGHTRCQHTTLKMTLCDCLQMSVFNIFTTTQHHQSPARCCCWRCYRLMFSVLWLPGLHASASLHYHQHLPANKIRRIWCGEEEIRECCCWAFFSGISICMIIVHGS